MTVDPSFSNVSYCFYLHSSPEIIFINVGLDRCLFTDDHQCEKNEIPF